MSYNYYQPLTTFARLAMGGLVLSALCDLLSVLLGLGQMLSPEFIIDLEGPYSFWLLAQSFVAVANIPVYLLTAIFFLIWLNKANKNLTPLGADYLEFSSGWAVGWWFIPFANLVKPFQVVKEVWRESDPEIVENTGFMSNVSGGSPGYIGLWWGLWIVSNIFNNIAARASEASSTESIQLSGAVFAASGATGVAAAVLAIMVVRDITQRQELRFAGIGLRRNQEPPPPPVFGGQGGQPAGQNETPVFGGYQ
jgi:hypothetical protein